MKLQSLLSFGLILGFSSPLIAQAHPGEDSRAHAAELALHRIERLVILKKVDEGFETKFSSLNLADAPAGSTPGAKYLAIARQVLGGDGTTSALNIYMDETGKSLSFDVQNGATSVNFPTWPDKDAVTLAESAMHYIEGAATQPEIDPYNDGFTSMKLTQGKNSSGAVVAIADVTSATTARVLRILIKTDGTFDSASVLP